MPEPQDAGDKSKNAQTKENLPPEALRALAEAKARREAAAAPKSQAEEQGGRGGLDPARYGDWEVKGLASDF